MRISELARSTGTPVATIRYYERIGLIPTPARTTSNYRAYAEPHAARLDFVRSCRGLGMPLKEIRTLLDFCDHPQRHCADVNVLLDRHIEHVEARVAELKSLSRHLRDLRAVCRSAGTAAECGILRRLSARKATARDRAEGASSPSSRSKRK
jgi:Cd(II)/Pb(II)-responsive transcriptional regulator